MSGETFKSLLGPASGYMYTRTHPFLNQEHGNGACWYVLDGEDLFSGILHQRRK
jgi:hypothetical protein